MSPIDFSYEIYLTDHFLDLQTRLAIDGEQSKSEIIRISPDAGIYNLTLTTFDFLKRMFEGSKFFMGIYIEAAAFKGALFPLRVRVRTNDDECERYRHPVSHDYYMLSLDADKSDVENAGLILSTIKKAIEAFNEDFNKIYST